MIYMICYDISEPKRLQRTAKVLENFGLRVQKSFFQCEITKERLSVLTEKIMQEIDVDEDYFFIYPLCESCTRKAKTDGDGEIIKLESFEII